MLARFVIFLYALATLLYGVVFFGLVVPSNDFFKAFALSLVAAFFLYLIPVFLHFVFRPFYPFDPFFD